MPKNKVTYFKGLKFLSGFNVVICKVFRQGCVKKSDSPLGSAGLLQMLEQEIKALLGSWPLSSPASEVAV